jgi:nucleoside-diphosphate-sugar epimerase
MNNQIKFNGASKVLITGVAGFIGSNLADRLLKEGHEVVGVDNLSYSPKEQIPQGVKFHKLDIRSKDIYPVFGGIDTVFHFAAKNSISDCQKDPLDTADINVLGTVNVFLASSKAKVRKIIYAETSAIYEGSTKLPTPEEDEHPHTFYAISKMATKYFAEGFERFHGLKMTALRYFNVYGPRQDYRRSIPPVFSAFIIKLLKGEQPIIYGDGSKRRDFVHVDDLNDFHILAMKDDRTNGKVYNLGTGKNVSILEIYQTIAKIIGTDIKPDFRPNLEGEAQENLADITKAKALGWAPKTNMEEGMKGMVEHIKQHVVNK